MFPIGQCGRGFIAGPTDYVRKCFDLFFIRTTFVGFECLREVSGISDHFPRVTAPYKIAQAWIIRFQTVPYGFVGNRSY